MPIYHCILLRRLRHVYKLRLHMRVCAQKGGVRELQCNAVCACVVF